MKYIQLCNTNEAKSYKDFVNGIITIDCHKQGLTTIEDLPINNYIKKLECQQNELTNLVGVRNLVNVEYINCSNNKLISLKGLDNFKSHFMSA